MLEIALQTTDHSELCTCEILLMCKESEWKLKQTEKATRHSVLPAYYVSALCGLDRSVTHIVPSAAVGATVSHSFMLPVSA